MAIALAIGVSSAFAAASEAPEGSTEFSPPWATQAGLAAAINGATRLPDASTDPAAAEGVPVGDLGRSEAADLLTGVFGEVLEQPGAIYDDLEVERFNSDYAAVVESEAGPPGLLASTLPLRTEDADGNKAPVDLDLALKDGSLQSENPLVDVEIPTDLGDGIAFPEVGITVNLAGAPDKRAPSNLEGESAFYPNVAPDRDLVVVPTPTGMETSTVLRSPDAPESQRFELSLPAGAELETAQDGGAIVRKGDQTLLRIRPPFAIDAEGESVPVDLKVADSAIVLETTPGDDAAWPILVDPIFESYSWMNTNTTTGINTDWRSSTGNEALFKPQWLGVWDATMHFGMNLRSYPGAIAPNTWATWYYYVPRFFSDPVRPTSFIKGMTLSQLYFLVEEKPVLHPHPLMFVFLWSENKGEFVSLGSHSSAEGQYIGTTLPPIANPQEVTDAKSGGIALATSESTSYPRQLFVGQATVELSDKGVPAFGSLGSVSGWVRSDPSSAINYSVSDTGLGVYQLQVKQPSAEGGASQVNTSANCVGTASQPCPRTLQSADRPLNYDPSTMPQGENWMNVTATDPIAQKSTVGESKVKVDHTKPTVSLSGTLAEQATLGTNLPEYALKYNATDGDKEAAEPLTPISNVGTGSGQMQKPTAIAVDGAGNIWVADRENNRVLKFDKNGVFQLQFGTAGTGNGQFNDPRGVAISPKTGNVWVSELGGNRVQEFKPNGEFVKKITAVGSGSFTDPYGIAVGADGTVWVVDLNGLNTVWMLNEQGTLLGYTHGTAAAPTSSTLELVDPTGVAVDANGNAWVTDSNLNRVIQYSKIDGRWLSQFGGAGSGDGQLSYPTGIAIGPSGGIFVADSNNNRIQQFKTDGSFTRKFGSAGSGSGQLSEARGVAVDKDGTVLAAEVGNKRVARWAHGDYDPQSGVVKVEVKVDGQAVPAAGKTQTCASTCPLNSEWTLDADDYSVGSHNVEVIATDGVELKSDPVVLNIETYGDRKDPTIALSGSMTEQASLGTTRPSYMLAVNATDPGEANERKSGVTDVKVKIDGTQVKSSSAGCPAGGCSLQTEWTLNNLSYSAGSHNVEVIATDAAGRSSSKSLTIDIARDTTAPTVTAANAFYNAPEGWVEQKSYAVSATGQDSAGFGITSMALKIDGEVVRSKTQECPSGGCGSILGFGQPLNMAAFEGGAHPAELRVADGAGNVAKKVWSINVNPMGTINVGEAEGTLEAFEETGDLNVLGEGSEEEQFLGGEAEFELVGTEYLAQEAGVPTALGVAPGEGLALPVPSAASLEPACTLAAQPQEEDETSEEPLAEYVGECTASENGEEQIGLEPVTVEPADTGAAATNTILLAENSAALSANLNANVDQVVKPLYNGAQTFMAIRDASAPDEYSWRVELEVDQELKQLNSRTVGVFYETGQRALLIEASAAHDAIGTELSTTMSIDGDDAVVLHVPHRGPSPAGGSYVYPVVGGAGWEGGFKTYQIEMPPGSIDESELGTDLEVEIVDNDNVLAVHVGYFGAPFAKVSSSGPVKEYPFRFNDCQFRLQYLEVDVPETGIRPPRREQLYATTSSCADLADGEDGDSDVEFKYGSTVYGVISMIPKKEIWIDRVPEKRIHCESWGAKDRWGVRRRAAVVDCFARPWRAKTEGITLRGQFRASSLTTGRVGPNATCLVPAMAVYPAKPFKELRDTWMQIKGEGDYFEPCDWP